jgi:signal transduction histidine kinase
MQRLLAQVAAATTLEAALKAQDLEPINLSDLLAAHLADFGLDRRDWQVEDAISADLWVNGDADSLIQMLDKLLDNAVTHGDPQYPLHIALRIQDAHAVLTIANRGGALPADTQSIFAPFVGSKRDRAQTPHLGLGLYVVRTIISRHQGTIDAERLKEPAGASFTVRLPLLAAQH